MTFAKHQHKYWVSVCCSSVQAAKGEWGKMEEWGSLPRLLSVSHLCFCHSKLRQNSPFCNPSLPFWHPGCCQISSFKSKRFKTKIFPCTRCSWNSFGSSRIWGQLLSHIRGEAEGHIAAQSLYGQQIYPGFRRSCFLCPLSIIIRHIKELICHLKWQDA